MLSYNESLKILKETEALLEGHFILSSGLHSKQYVQCAKLLSHPKKAEAICSSLCEKINKSLKNIDIVFDMITLWHVLEHLNEPKKIVNLIEEKLS